MEQETSDSFWEWPGSMSGSSGCRLPDNFRMNFDDIFRMRKRNGKL